MIIVTLLTSLITFGFKSNNNYSEKTNKILSDLENGDVTVEQYKSQIYELNYEIQKSNIKINIVNVTLYIGYFIVFGYLNKGQTIGKKLFKIKIVDNDNKCPKGWQMIVRSLFIYNIISILYNVITINFLSINSFNVSYTAIGYAESLFVFISFFMIIYKKDGKGLHDIIAKTKVIDGRS